VKTPATAAQGGMRKTPSGATLNPSKPAAAASSKPRALPPQPTSTQSLANADASLATFKEGDCYYLLKTVPYLHSRRLKTKNNRIRNNNGAICFFFCSAILGYNLKIARQSKRARDFVSHIQKLFKKIFDYLS
jgi:hypothetical protein